MRGYRCIGFPACSGSRLFLLLLGVGIWCLGAAPIVGAGGEGDFRPDRLDTTVADQFSPFEVQGTRSLREVLGEGAVAEDTWVLVTETAAGSLALLTEQMAYHHVAQGVANGVGWMATF